MRYNKNPIYLSSFIYTFIHFVIAKTNGRLKGARVFFDTVTVTGTENILMAATLAVPPALAVDGTYTRSANSGQKKWMDEYSGWNNDCSFMTISVDVIEPPAHGKVTPRPEIKRIPKVAKRGSSGACAGRTIAWCAFILCRCGRMMRKYMMTKMRMNGANCTSMPAPPAPPPAAWA